MDTKKFVPVSVYLTPEDMDSVMEFAKMMNQTKSGAIELLVRRALGKLGDVEIEDFAKGLRRGNND